MDYSKPDALPLPTDFFYNSNSSDVNQGSYIYVALNSFNNNQSIFIDYNQSCNMRVFVLKDATNITSDLRPITTSQLHRLHNAALRISLDIIIVGSRANGTARETSDWDYIIKELNNRKWKKIKNSMPGAKTKDRPRNIDIVRTNLDKSKPHILVRYKESLDKLLGYGGINYVTTQ